MVERRACEAIREGAERVSRNTDDDIERMPCTEPSRSECDAVGVGDIAA
jgi:hypothetical protein